MGRSIIPYDLFDVERSAEEARRAEKLRNIYTVGQELAWDGSKVLESLIDKHGPPRPPEPVKQALGQIFSTILWGELAAWRVSAELAAEIESVEPKMAATSQAFDEARHLTVFYDYLMALGVRPAPMAPASHDLLAAVLNEKDLTLKLVGMQLMVESTALTIFQAVRDTACEPVLCELLPYIEKDEARHVGLGVQYLPERLRDIDGLRALRITAFELKLIYFQLSSVAALEQSLRTLGIVPTEIIRLGIKKQVMASNMMWEALGGKPNPRVADTISRGVQAIAEAWFPPDSVRRSAWGRLAAARDAWRNPVVSA